MPVSQASLASHPPLAIDFSPPVLPFSIAIRRAAAQGVDSRADAGLRSLRTPPAIPAQSTTAEVPRSMNFGIFHLMETPDPEHYAQHEAEVAEQSVLAEELGFHGVWLAEHHFDRDYGLCPSTLMYAVKLA